MTTLDVAKSLYTAFADLDRQAIAGLLDRSFKARVSSGMPLGVGGPVTGPQAMFSKVWGPLSAAYDAEVHPEEFVEVALDRVIVFGFYRGTSRSTSNRFQSAFAHDLTIHNGKITSLIQITDTKPWHDALTAPPETL
ncbi:nuclear transport factor 2 family protein [Nocardia brasiliensis]